MDNLIKNMLPYFSGIIRFPGTWGVTGVGVLIVGVCFNSSAYAALIVLFGVVLFTFFIGWIIKCVVGYVVRKKAILFSLHSLGAEEKDVLRSMLKSEVNQYEIKVSHDIDPNAQTKQAVLACRLICLKDKGLLDLTQTPYDERHDLMSASMPVLVWGIMRKKYKKDPNYFIRISNAKRRKTSIVKKCAKILRTKRKKK